MSAPATAEVIQFPKRRPRDAEPERFAEFYGLYPRKVARRTAAKAFAGALRRATADEIIAGLRGYRFSPETQYQPHPSTWLNGDRWLDQQVTAQSAACSPVLVDVELPGADDSTLTNEDRTWLRQWAATPSRMWLDLMCRHHARAFRYLCRTDPTARAMAVENRWWRE
jgi:hypothetical protein